MTQTKENTSLNGMYPNSADVRAAERKVYLIAYGCTEKTRLGYPFLSNCNYALNFEKKNYKYALNLEKM